jgi:hypothetical protein
VRLRAGASMRLRGAGAHTAAHVRTSDASSNQPARAAAAAPALGVWQPRALVVTRAHPRAAHHPTWNPRSTGHWLLLSVSVWPPHVSSDSNSVTLAPLLHHGKPVRAVGGVMTAVLPQGVWLAVVRRVTPCQHCPHLCSSQAVDRPVMPLPTTATLLPAQSAAGGFGAAAIVLWMAVLFEGRRVWGPSHYHPVVL